MVGIQIINKNLMYYEVTTTADDDDDATRIVHPDDDVDADVDDRFLNLHTTLLYDDERKKEKGEKSEINDETKRSCV
jgi:hypothetical protein